MYTMPSELKSNETFIEESLMSIEQSSNNIINSSKHCDCFGEYKTPKLKNKTKYFQYNQMEPSPQLFTKYLNNESFNNSSTICMWTKPVYGNKNELPKLSTEQLSCKCVGTCKCIDCIFSHKVSNTNLRPPESSNNGNEIIETISSTIFQCECNETCNCKEECKLKPCCSSNNNHSELETVMKFETVIKMAKSHTTNSSVSNNNFDLKTDEKSTNTNKIDETNKTLYTSTNQRCVCFGVCECDECPRIIEKDTQIKPETPPNNHLKPPEKKKCKCTKICNCICCKGENPSKDVDENDKQKDKKKPEKPDTCFGVCECNDCQRVIEKDVQIKPETPPNNHLKPPEKKKCTCTKICNCICCKGENPPKDANENDKKKDEKKPEKLNTTKLNKKLEDKTSTSSTTDVCKCTDDVLSNYPSTQKIHKPLKQKCHCTDFQCLPDDFKVKYPPHRNNSKSRSNINKSDKPKKPSKNSIVNYGKQSNAKLLEIPETNKKANMIDTCKCADLKKFTPNPEKNTQNGESKDKHKNKESDKRTIKCKCKTFECLPENITVKIPKENEQRKDKIKIKVCKCKDFECLPDIKSTKSILKSTQPLQMGMNPKMFDNKSEITIDKSKEQSQSLVKLEESQTSTELKPPEIALLDRKIVPLQSTESVSDQKQSMPCSFSPECQCATCFNSQQMSTKQNETK